MAVIECAINIICSLIFIKRGRFYKHILEATNSQGGMSLSSFKVEIKGSGMSGLADNNNYGQSGEPFFSFLCDEAQLLMFKTPWNIEIEYLGEGQINYPILGCLQNFN